MRKPTYLSPSALAKYEWSPEDYFCHYLSDKKPAQEPQTNAMSVGSAFDAYVKSYLHDMIYGKNHAESAKYELRTLFDAQVDSQWRDEMWVVGAYLFAQYKSCGALGDLMLEIQNAVDEPRFEFEVKGIVEGQREAVSGKRMGVPLLGRPDIRFINADGAHVIFDWKVNGWFAKGNTSPVAGYLKCREQDGNYWKQGSQHKNCQPMQYKGMWINGAGYLEDWKAEWATQLATYGWLLGEAVGVELAVGIDQIACHGGKRSDLGYPNLRIASHCAKVSSKFQFETIARYIKLWDLVTAEPFHFFRDLTLEESASKCELLNAKAELYLNESLSDDEKWALGLGKKGYF